MKPSGTSGLALAALVASATMGQERPNRRIPNSIKSIMSAKQWQNRKKRNKIAKQSRKKNRS